MNLVVGAPWWLLVLLALVLFAAAIEDAVRFRISNFTCLALILVEAHSVEYLVVTKPKPVVLFEVAKAIVTGTPPKVGEERSLNERELRTEAAREAR